MRPEWLVELTSPQQALDVGYQEGGEYREHSRRRENGYQPHMLTDDRETFFERGHPFERDPRNLYYEPWRRGFDAGYLGEPKPLF